MTLQHYFNIEWRLRCNVVTIARWVFSIACDKTSFSPTRRLRRKAIYEKIKGKKKIGNKKTYY